ncbi:uncharacterized protein VICG_00355 [Vittaforma corneae ATCC 50505]|uniref:Uncharacterized protein n=1 Tax=Vittaforma corneae (strain ATCC 50505) TaxID=993615 RepID=L2GP14_VITCO|nr:uncharacterized protein VICG_00355 [Vittaforma corneae ATCC 50505]ELA42603.1 hypothetical protein VICG_00355 [Vittaforma corneae ATCC 50505]
MKSMHILVYFFSLAKCTEHTSNNTPIITPTAPPYDDQPPAYSPFYGYQNEAYQHPSQYGFTNYNVPQYPPPPYSSLGQETGYVNLSEQPPNPQFGFYGQSTPQYPSPYFQQGAGDVNRNEPGMFYPEEEGESTEKLPITDDDNGDQGRLYPSLDDLLGSSDQASDSLEWEEEIGEIRAKKGMLEEQGTKHMIVHRMMILKPVHS